MKRTVIFILSTNFSGSHFLSLLLGSHSQAAHVGEVKNLAKVKNKGIQSSKTNESTRQCYLCEGETSCTLLGDMHLLTKEEIYPTLFKRIGNNTNLIVDASKKTAWAKQFLNNKEFEVKFIHLIRDPRALVRKWKQHYITPKEQLKQRLKQARIAPEQSLPIFLRETEQTYSLKWANQNREIANFLDSHTLDKKRITYHELATEPEKTVTEIMNWLTLDYEPSQLNYWTHQHHGTQKPNYDWVKESENQFIDLRWQTELSKETADQIIQNKKVAQLLFELNLIPGEDGLKKKVNAKN